MRTLGVKFWSGGRLMVSRAASVFDAGGALVEPGVQRQLEEFVQGFATFAASWAPVTAKEP